MVGFLFVNFLMLVAMGEEWQLKTSEPISARHGVPARNTRQRANKCRKLRYRI